jgi:hypothetical protein
MKSLWKRVVLSTLIVGVAASLTGTLLAQDSGPAGIVRISRPKTSDIVNGQVTPTSAMMMDGSCNVVNGGAASGLSGACDPSSAGPVEIGGGYGHGHHGYRKYARQDWRTSSWQGDNSWGSDFHRRAQMHSMAVENSWGKATGHYPSVYYHDHSGQAMIDYFKCKFGYFIPTGGGGQGIPWVGHYGRVYPVNPYYNDSRDGQVWAAQGYGVPISVPLAPVVGHTYEYGWGVPSSRLVPVSHPAY